MAKTLEEYNDKELAEKIKELDTEIRNEKKATNCEQDERNKKLIEVLKKKEDYLKQLHAEHYRRRDKT